MNPRRIALLLVALAASSRAREPQAPAETMRQFAAYMQESKEVQKRLRVATREAHLKERAAQMKGSALYRPYDAKRVEQVRGQLASYEARLEGVQAELEVASIEDPDERKARLKELEEEATGAQQALQDAMAPLNEEHAGIQEEQAPVRELLEELLEPVGRVAQDLGVARANASMQPGSGAATLAWHDVQGRQLAYVHLRLLPSRQGNREEVMKLAEKYPVHRLNDGSLSFSVGSLTGSFSSNKAEWRNRKELPKLVEALIDFGALADLGAALEGDGEIRQQLTDCVTKEREWQTRMRDATRGPQSWCSTVQQGVQELRRPYDANRLEQLESRIASYEKNMAGARAQLSVATIEDPEKRKAERVKANEEAKQARQEVLAAGAPLRAEQVALMRKARYVEFAVWEMMAGVVRTPEGTGIVEAAVRVRGRLDRGNVSVSFKDAHTKQLVSAYLRFQPMPENMNEQAKLADTYPVQSQGSSSINFWVGEVNVNLNVQKVEWRDKDKVLELATSLFDLDAIAAWPALEVGE